MRSQPIATPNEPTRTLIDAPIDPEWIISGQPSARVGWLVKSNDRTVSFVVWDCTCGIFRWHYEEEESFIVTAGEAFITKEDEREYRLRPGDMAYCPAGSSCTWRVPNYIKKVAVLRRSLPLPVTLFAKVWYRLMRAVRDAGRLGVPSPLSSTSATPLSVGAGGPLAEVADVVSIPYANSIAPPGATWGVVRAQTPSTGAASPSYQSGVGDPKTVEISVGRKP